MRYIIKDERGKIIKHNAEGCSVRRNEKKKLGDIIGLFSKEQTINLCDEYGFIREITLEDMGNEKILSLEVKEIFAIEEDVIGIQVK